MEGYEVKDEIKGRCLECGEEVYGRGDRKFCCLECKNKYNNRRQQDSRTLKLKIHNALNRNHEILTELLKIGMTEIDLMDLRRLGFRTDLVTSYRHDYNEDELCCYDIRYVLANNKVRNIFRMPGYRSLEK